MKDRKRLTNCYIRRAWQDCGVNNVYIYYSRSFCFKQQGVTELCAHGLHTPKKQSIQKSINI